MFINQIISKTKEVGYNLGPETSRVFLDANGDISFKHHKDEIEDDKQVAKRIYERVLQEGAHPSVARLVKNKLVDFWSQNGTKALKTPDLQDLCQSLNPLIKKIETKSYIKDIARDARGRYVDVLKLIGIDPAVDYDETSEQYLAIIEELEKQGIDLVYSENAIRYMNAAILSRYEADIWEKIDIEDKSSAVALRGKLCEFKELEIYNNYVLDKLIAQAEVWELMQNNPKLSKFPFEDVWRFVIDVEFQEYGAYIFENEPGYIVATLRALAFGLGLKKPTYSDYIKINSLCGENVRQSLNPITGCLNTHVRDHEPAAFGVFDFENIDPEGLQDLEERTKKPNNFFLLGAYVLGSPKCGPNMVQMRAVSLKENLYKMEFLFEEYEKKIIDANKGERLIAQLWLSKELDLHHHFLDGNYRTSRILLEGLLANDPELPMMLLDTNPNLIVGSGLIPSIKRTLKGMSNFNKVCGSEEIPLTFEEVDSMTQVSEKSLWSNYHPSDEDYETYKKG